MKKKFLKTFITALAVASLTIISPGINANAVDPTVNYQSLTDKTASTNGDANITVNSTEIYNVEIPSLYQFGDVAASATSSYVYSDAEVRVKAEGTALATTSNLTISVSDDNLAELKKDGTSDTDKLTYGIYSAHSGTTAGTPISNPIVTATGADTLPKTAPCDVGFDRTDLKSVGTYSGILKFTITLATT